MQLEILTQFMTSEIVSNEEMCDTLKRTLPSCAGAWQRLLEAKTKRRLREKEVRFGI